MIGAWSYRQPATLNIKARKLCIPEVCCNMACRDHYNAADPLISAITTGSVNICIPRNQEMLIETGTSLRKSASSDRIKEQDAAITGKIT